MDRTLLRGDINARGILAKLIIGFLLKASQGLTHHKLGVINLIRYCGLSYSKTREILAKLTWNFC